MSSAATVAAVARYGDGLVGAGDDGLTMGQLHRGAGPPRRYSACPLDPSNLQILRNTR